MRRLSLPLEDIDPRGVPGDHQGPGSSGYATAVLAQARRAVRRIGGDAQVRITGNALVVDWTPGSGSKSPIDQIIPELQRGNLGEGTLLLQLLLSEQPENADILYNLGMALSDGHQADLAERYLRRLVRVDPGYENGYAALGVALQRQGKSGEAIEALRRGLDVAPNNPWIQRNLGASLLQASDAAAAVEHLREATRLNESDQRAWLGLGQALEATGEGDAADRAYRRAVDLDQTTDAAEAARSALRRMAEATFRAALPSTVRPDAVMYCLNGLETFSRMTAAEVQSVGFEIAMLGTQGLDVNSPERKHNLENLPGEFTGLHLVCLMYVAFKQIAPEQDIGFDLASEYAVAQSFHETGAGSG